ncbi:MAG TPA: hypothetical protein VFU99_05990 [Gaiellaceae bacterium]|nr:hypothetical protein [Gaiellaceae bacterium]
MHPEPESDRVPEYEKDRIAWNLPLPADLRRAHRAAVTKAPEPDQEHDEATPLEPAA